MKRSRPPFSLSRSPHSPEPTRSGPDEIVDLVARTLPPTTKLAVFDAVTSNTALVLPIQRLVQLCRSRWEQGCAKASKCGFGRGAMQRARSGGGHERRRGLGTLVKGQRQLCRRRRGEAGEAVSERSEWTSLAGKSCADGGLLPICNRPFLLPCECLQIGASRS